jgi:hypothetical protein
MAGYDRTAAFLMRARQVAEASGASLYTARAALRRFRAGQIPVARSPGLEPKTVRNVHVMLHAAFANAVKWRYLVENVAEHVKPPKLKRRKPTVWNPAQLRTFLTKARADRCAETPDEGVSESVSNDDENAPSEDF